MSHDNTLQIPKTEAHNALNIDGARARELYKYFRPPSLSNPTTSDVPDTVLTAHAQLVAWRLNAQRAMVSLIDQETQYFVAESTKTLFLDDALQHDDPDDANWVLQAAQCVDVPKTGRLCEHTIATVTPPDGGPACFEVLDLSKDDRFNKLEFVSGPPHFRYYVGVPLRTKRGVNIGSLFAMDDKPRKPISRSVRHFLGVMGDNVVQHLEMIKEKKDRQRLVTMNRCLSAFLDSSHQTPNGRPNSTSSAQRKASRGAQQSSQATGRNASSTSDSDSNSTSGRRVEMDDNLRTFNRAADLLREGLDLEDGGGIIFLDTLAAKARSKRRDTKFTEKDSWSSQESGKEDLPWNTNVHSTQTKTGNLHTSYTHPAAILAQSHSFQITGSSRYSHDQYMSMSTTELSALIQRHPRGKLFTFDADGLLSPSSSDEQAPSLPYPDNSKPKRTTSSQTEIELLRRSFPTSRQIMFLPLWDSTSMRWSACFAHNSSEFRAFSHSLDFLYCITFTNCVMVENSRLSIIIADQQKSDFIGSVSHEFRSPLHGILASCEFLADTDCTSFQRSLVDTADGCARTLLDTINMVLDYSKINMLEKNVNRARKSRRKSLWDASSGTNPELQSHLSTHSDVDIAFVTEEVVEVVAAGHFFHNRVINLDMQVPTETSDSKDSSYSPGDKQNVDIVLFIPKRDWVYWCQAGALRRIVMNLFSNSLKYTKHGFIKVELDVEEAKPSQETTTSSNIILTITDSGRGMSSEYIRTKLFVPFAQESSIAPGVGLGLSLVKSIVNMLGGEIDVTSTLDVGTTIRVKLPMTRATQRGSSPGSTTTTSPGELPVERFKDSSIETIHAEVSNRTVAVYWEDRIPRAATDGQAETSVEMRKSVERYLQEWYGYQVSAWNLSSHWDVVVIEEVDFPELIATVPQLLEPECQTKVLILRNKTATQIGNAPFPDRANFEQLHHPFGPYKLARALRVCLERGQSRRVTESYGDAGFTLNNRDQKTSQQIDKPLPRENINSFLTNNNSPSKKENQAITANNQKADTEATTVLPMRSKINPSGDDKTTLSVTQNGFQIHTIKSPTSDPRNQFDDPPKITPIPTSTATQQNSDPHNAISSTPRMLLVDDNTINLRLLQTYLKKRSYPHITIARDGLAAVTTYTTLLSTSVPPDIIFMDISMPVMDGFTATKRIREIERKRVEEEKQEERDVGGKKGMGEGRKNCLIVALTGLASERDQNEAFMCGVDLFVTKPVGFSQVEKIIEGWVTERDKDRGGGRGGGG